VLDFFSSQPEESFLASTWETHKSKFSQYIESLMLASSFLSLSLSLSTKEGEDAVLAEKKLQVDASARREEC
jgi:hypothetical protein